jgi:hypothetical protein
MKDNPIMQRVMMLTEMWKTATSEHKNVPVFSWVGSSLVEFKTIKGFTIFQTSNEKTFEDTVFCLQHPFHEENLEKHAHILLNAIHNVVEAWNKDEKLTKLSDGIINWSYVAATEGEDVVNAKNFISYLGKLANTIDSREMGFKLILALYPQHIANFKSYTGWIESLLQQDIPSNLKFMLYDGADAMMFKEVAEKYPNEFRYLYPDLDISGAMDEILQSAKSSGKTASENDAISFQQALIKLTDAIGYAQEKDVKFYKNECFRYTQKHSWLHLEALVHFYLHGYYASVNEDKKAVQHIDLAITKADTAHEKGIEGTQEMQYHYRIAKGNMFFMKKELDKAVATYKDCLTLPVDGANPLMLAGIHQMLGNALRKASSKREARKVFTEGWKWLEQLDEALLKTNAMTMFYAKDMLEVADNEMYGAYAGKFENWWGRNWQKQIRSGQLQTETNSIT